MLEVRYIYDVDNKPVNEYTIRNGRYRLSVINLGAAITKIIVPNKMEKLENITLRYYDYKAYKYNPYYLGCLINYKQFINGEKALLNYYFECTLVEEDTLKFTYQKETNYISVCYKLKDDQLTIRYDTNLDFPLANVLFFNLSGNVKEDIKKHELMLASQDVSLTQSIPFFKGFSFKNQDTVISLHYPENGIQFNIETNNRDIYLSFGKYFNNEFFINKKRLAEEFSGIGMVLGGQNMFSMNFEDK